MNCKPMPASNKIVRTYTIHSMNDQDLATWYESLSYFNLCQLQDVTGYSSAAGLAKVKNLLVIHVDDCGNIYPELDASPDRITAIITAIDVQAFLQGRRSLSNIRRHETPPTLTSNTLTTYCHRVPAGYETVVAYRLTETVTQDAVAYTFSQQDDAIRLMEIFADVIASNRLG